jgi:hypothetical protein
VFRGRCLVLGCAGVLGLLSVLGSFSDVMACVGRLLGVFAVEFISGEVVVAFWLGALGLLPGSVLSCLAFCCSPVAQPRLAVALSGLRLPSQTAALRAQLCGLAQWVGDLRSAAVVRAAPSGVCRLPFVYARAQP